MGKGGIIHLIGLISVLEIERVVDARDRGTITRLIKKLFHSRIYIDMMDNKNTMIVVVWSSLNSV